MCTRAVNAAPLDDSSTEDARERAFKSGCIVLTMKPLLCQKRDSHLISKCAQIIKRANLDYQPGKAGSSPGGSRPPVSSKFNVLILQIDLLQIW